MKKKLRQSLVEQGFCVAPAVLDHDTIGALQRYSQAALERISAQHRRNNKSQGSLINLSDYPEFSAIIAHPGLAGLFAGLAFPDPVFSSGYIISKPPHSPALFWHQDWWGWDDPLSYTDTIAQVFIMIYLTDTSPQNGCLRVIPGSHRKRHRLHEAASAHAESLSKVENPDDPLYQSCAGELAVGVGAGDVVVGDARLVHGAYPNNSSQERTLLTLWYHPDFYQLPAGMQARIQEIFLRRGVDTDPGETDRMTLNDWPAEHKEKTEYLLPAYRGDAAPHAWNRQPDTALMIDV